MGKKGEQRKRLIKDEAYMLFARYGFKSVTMKDICVATGLSRGGLYRHYDGTSQIFSEILEEISSNQHTIFKDKMVKKIPAMTILNETLDRIKEEILDSKRSLSLAIYEYSNLYKSDYMESFYNKAKAAWGEFIRYGIRKGEFNKVHVDQVVDLILFSYQGARMWSSVMELDGTIAENITSQIKLILEAAK